jgi:hypothetical protein
MLVPNYRIVKCMIAFLVTIYLRNNPVRRLSNPSAYEKMIQVGVQNDSEYLPDSILAVAAIRAFLS